MLRRRQAREESFGLEGGRGVEFGVEAERLAHERDAGGGVASSDADRARVVEELRVLGAEGQGFLRGFARFVTLPTQRFFSLQTVLSGHFWSGPQRPTAMSLLPAFLSAASAGPPSFFSSVPTCTQSGTERHTCPGEHCASVSQTEGSHHAFAPSALPTAPGGQSVGAVAVSARATAGAVRAIASAPETRAETRAILVCMGPDDTTILPRERRPELPTAAAARYSGA